MTRATTDFGPRLPALVRAARPRQWLKNGLVLLAPAAAGVLDQGDPARDTALAVVAFCLASSTVYLLNDVADAEADRAHPIKRSRPVSKALSSTWSRAGRRWVSRKSRSKTA